MGLKNPAFVTKHFATGLLKYSGVKAVGKTAVHFKSTMRAMRAKLAYRRHRQKCVDSAIEYGYREQDALRQMKWQLLPIGLYGAGKKLHVSYPPTANSDCELISHEPTFHAPHESANFYLDYLHCYIVANGEGVKIKLPHGGHLYFAVTDMVTWLEDGYASEEPHQVFARFEDMP